MPKIKFVIKQSAFTLIEILIALFIFAIIAVITASVLHTVYDARQNLKVKETQLTALQITTALLQHDMRQIINRPSIANNGSKQAAVVGLFNEVDFSCACNSGLDAINQQSDLQRIKYYVQNGDFIRQSYASVDQNDTNASSKKVLLTHVTQFEVNYLDSNNLFAQTWFMENNNNQLPKAIYFKITLQKLGQFNLLLPLP